mgnify:CR=1 FL=1
MYLKALEIQGFKSFPDKTVLNFGEDITAIVGPNGSGKSNISDAIRWVMGEQSSKSLRGVKMEDVIFGGTETRNQMGFAQVTLVLDNTEHIFPSMEETEVAVTRRYYRSGESEYYINKQSVRLRDVNELFMDTGMGREGYSIIGQGRIDEILSQKSGDRREIFEEAAGISRFRYRKEETERKLERTEENLVRINDKIAELELQVEPLRAQAETAKQYLIYRDELRLLEISVWLENLETLKTNAIKLDTDLSLAREELKKANADLEALYAASEQFSARIHENDITQEEKRIIRVHDLEVNCQSRTVVLGGQPVRLTAKEFDLLQLLITHRGKVYSREALLETVWKYDYMGDMRTVDVHIRRLREKIERDNAGPEFILTKWGVGYYFTDKD